MLVQLKVCRAYITTTAIQYIASVVALTFNRKYGTISWIFHNCENIALTKMCTQVQYCTVRKRYMQLYTLSYSVLWLTLVTLRGTITTYIVRLRRSQHFNTADGCCDAVHCCSSAACIMTKAVTKYIAYKSGMHFFCIAMLYVNLYDLRTIVPESMPLEGLRIIQIYGSH